MEPLKGMKFARKVMEGLGWKEGNGLGLNQNGITEAIKPSQKFDVSGLGHKTYNDFQWWDHAFNRAANSFDVKVKNDQVIIEKGETNIVRKIKTKKSVVVEPESLAYGTFCKTSTLTNGVMENKTTSTVLKEEKDYSLKISDEELFKMCNGLTAHKGARHGLTASGKLARIAQQEALMMASFAQDTPNLKKDKGKKQYESKNLKNPALEQKGGMPDDLADIGSPDNIPNRKRKSKNQTEDEETPPDERHNDVKKRKCAKKNSDSPIKPLKSDDKQQSRKRERKNN